MILPDINLLVYAHNLRAAKHEAALAWWNSCLGGRDSAALAIDRGLVLHTTDADFSRFSGLKWRNPLPA